MHRSQKCIVEFFEQAQKAGRKLQVQFMHFLFAYCAYIEELPIFLWKLRILMKIAVTAHHSLT